MHWPPLRAHAALVVAGLLVMPSRADRIGSRLSAGMQLVYSSGGVETPWTIDSVVTDTTFGGRRGCAWIRLRTSPTQGTPETRALCADETRVFAWDERTGELRPSRPLGAGGVLDVPQAGGASVRYETSAATVERIDNQSFEVIPTTVTTRDSTGRIVRRLRERFSAGLATATGGVFEVPDSTEQGGWRTTRSFELVAVRPR